MRRFTKAVFVFFTVLFGLGMMLAYAATFVSPATFPLLAFFGLGYPVLVAVNMLALIFWAAKWSRWTFFTVTILLLGIPIHSRFFQYNPGSGEIPESAQTLSVMSYNVELFGWYHWKTNDERRNNVFQQLAENKVDIYCFQEFFYTNIPGRFDTRDSLTELLNAPHYHDHYTHEMHQVQFYGIATMSRHPIVNRGVIEFPNDKNNVCIYTDIMVDDEIIRVYNVHLCSIRFSGDDHEYAGDLQTDPGLLQDSRVMMIYYRLKNAFVKRSWQADLVREHMDNSPYPIILCGDFNDTPVSYAYAVFNEILNDTFRSYGNGTGNTYIGNFPSFRIDYIFTSPEFTHVRHEVLPEELSDHRAVKSEIYY